MATIVNMGDLYRDIWDMAASRRLVAEAKTWFAKRMPAEAARREDWWGNEPHYDQWNWLFELTDEERRAMEHVKVVAERHVARAVASGEVLVTYAGIDEVPLVADWLASLPGEDPGMLRKLLRVTWAQAVDHSRLWHERLAKRQTDALTAAEMAEGTTAVLNLPDGWRWVRLETEAALDAEGQAMGHCVGSGGYDGLTRATSPDGIYSLRDRRGCPHATVEVRDGAIQQAQGKGNTSPCGHSSRLGALVQVLEVSIGRAAPGLFGMAVVNDKLMPITEAMGCLEAGRVEGNVDLRGADIAQLPDGLSVDGYLDLRGCTSLTGLPGGLSVGGGLSLSFCTSLTCLPDGLSIGRYLELRGCTSLTSLSDGMSVGGDLDLRGCTSLTRLPEGMSFGGDVNLCGCTSLTSLSDGMSVGGDLDLSFCTSLTGLPEGMSVGGDLDLRVCTSLTGLPDDLSVDGSIYGANHLLRATSMSQ